MREKLIDLEKVYQKLKLGEPLSDEENLSVAVIEKVRNAQILQETFGIKSQSGLPRKILALLRGRSAQES
jgi:hypothetical protein